MHFRFLLSILFLTVGMTVSQPIPNLGHQLQQRGLDEFVRGAWKNLGDAISGVSRGGRSQYQLQPQERPPQQQQQESVSRVPPDPAKDSRSTTITAATEPDPNDVPEKTEFLANYNQVKSRLSHDDVWLMECIQQKVSLFAVCCPPQQFSLKPS